MRCRCLMCHAASSAPSHRSAWGFSSIQAWLCACHAVSDSCVLPTVVGVLCLSDVRQPGSQGHHV